MSQTHVNRLSKTALLIWLQFRLMMRCQLSAVDVRQLALFAGTHSFYRKHKLPFMGSHRDRGIQDTLIVAP